MVSGFVDEILVLDKISNMVPGLLDTLPKRTKHSKAFGRCVGGIEEDDPMKMCVDGKAAAKSGQIW